MGKLSLVNTIIHSPDNGSLGFYCMFKSGGAWNFVQRMVRINLLKFFSYTMNLHLYVFSRLKVFAFYSLDLFAFKLNQFVSKYL